MRYPTSPRAYGWNFTAQSDGEMICDGIAFLIFALSFVVPPLPTSPVKE